LVVASIGSTASRPAWFKAALFALLSLNTAVFLASGTPSEALDSIAWLTLLVLFELETGYIGRLREGRSISAVRALRLAAAAALVAAMTGYVHEKEWLDSLNVGLWCAVIALLEFEVRRPDVAMRHRVPFAVAALALYSGLLALVAAWLWRGEWFDAYDAALWLVAFATLEMDVLSFIGKGRPATE
jgi:peptidoglycan/LPS O-acetylase OafA/YrhL